MSKKVFREEQRFKAYDLIALLISIMIVLTIMVYKELLKINEYGYGMLFANIAALVTLGYAMYYLSNLELKTAISTKNISFKIKNWHSKKQKIHLEDIECCSIVKTPLINQLHGANIPYPNEHFYSFSGRNGISLKTKDGHQYFIGSRRLGELEQVLKEITQDKRSD